MIGILINNNSLFTNTFKTFSPGNSKKIYYMGKPKQKIYVILIVLPLLYWYQEGGVIRG